MHAAVLAPGPDVARALVRLAAAGSAERTASAPPRTGTSPSHRAAHARRRERWVGEPRRLTESHPRPPRRPNAGDANLGERATTQRRARSREDASRRRRHATPRRRAREGMDPDRNPPSTSPRSGSRRETADRRRRRKSPRGRGTAIPGLAGTQTRTRDRTTTTMTTPTRTRFVFQRGNTAAGVVVFLPGGGLVVERGSRKAWRRDEPRGGGGGGGDGGGVRDRGRGRGGGARRGMGIARVETGRRPETRGGGAGGGVRAAAEGRRERLRWCRTS